MQEFQPDYRHIVNAAYNKQTSRFSLYEHIIDDSVMERIIGKKFTHLYEGDDNDLVEYFRIFCEFFRSMGYDTVSYENTIGNVMPGSGALGGHIPGVIQNREDFEKYPWEEVPELYFKRYSRYFDALKKAMPLGMLGVGGVGNGVFECVQDLVGYENLCYIRMDDKELYGELFNKVGQTNLAIWKRFMSEYGDLFCVLRFGDDMGFNTSTLLPEDDIRQHIVPNYIPIINEVHSYNKPFLLHSCGCIFSVMEDLIGAGINAKHSNEDSIARFWIWVDKYGDKIGNFGGIDTDVVCRAKKDEMRDYIEEVVAKSYGKGGFAFGSGNSIPDYVPPENFLMMNQIVREIRQKI